MKTKKHSLNKTIKTGILIFGISLLLWNCKQDQEEVLEILTIEHAIPQYSKRMIGVIEIPKVEKYLIDKLPKNTFERNNEDSGIFINYNDVLETDAWSSAIQNGNISSTEADNIINANNQEDTNGASANGSPCS